jgi:hypothetical protein
MNEQDQYRFANGLSQLLMHLHEVMAGNSAYLARAEIAALHSTHRANPGRLEPFGFKAYSQNDEDGILAEIFRRLGIAEGTFCEIGVENGLECNTLFLLHQGWRGAWLEGNPDRKGAIESKFASLLRNRRLSLGIGYVVRGNVNGLIHRHMALLKRDPEDLDFLSIDIDGMDIYLLEALDIRPKVICVEYNAKFPPPILKRPVYSEDYRWPGTDYMGSSLAALDAVARDKGYALVGTNLTGANAFFVRSDLLHDRFHSDLTPAALYNPPRYYLIDHYQRHVGHRADFGAYADLEMAATE